MKIELKELTLHDWLDCYAMLQEIWPGENGFENTWYGVNYRDFLQKCHDQSLWVWLAHWRIPQTLYRLYIDGEVIWYGKLRHFLNEKLLEEWGHIGYCIRPTERGKWYGNIILWALLQKAKEKWIDKVLLTCNNDNIPSKKTIERYGWNAEHSETKCRYWITL